MVGFHVDPGITSFTMFVVLAADLFDVAPAPTGSISGSVSSPLRGALPGVTVTAQPGALVVTTGAGGGFSFANLPIGDYTLTLSSLPTGCTDPGPMAATVTALAVTVANFSVPCSQALLANAGADQDANVGTTVQLDGSASTGPAGFTYQWTQVQGPSVTLTGGDGPTPSFAAPAMARTLRFALRVMDGAVASSQSFVTINVFEDVSAAIFVAPTGNDLSPGTRAAPLRTIVAALAMAAGVAGADVYVQAGSYSGSLTFAPGVSVYGSYDTDWRRPTGALGDPLAPTTVVAGGSIAARGAGLAAQRIEGLRITSIDQFAPGASSIALLLTSAGGDLVLAHNAFVAGRGGAGVRGRDGTHSFRTFPMNGGPGGAGSGDGSTPGLGGIGGASGGALGGPPGANGGRGGSEQQNGANGNIGSGGGSPAGGGGGGIGGAWGDPGRAGTDGQDGGNGSPGINGAGGTSFGVMTAAGYSAAGGTDGTNGMPGYSGGGGGGGGGQHCTFCIDGSGNGGGGGGAGGPAGGGGTAGTGGGGSFALVLIERLADVQLVNNTFITADGGAGGDGGDGGLGDLGGIGGTGGSVATDEVGRGGNGGAGGEGGRGGHGGGGGGGPSVGVLDLNSIHGIPLVVSTNDFTLGDTGQGGLHGGLRGIGGNYIQR
jgi:hypothetical protein